LIHVLTLLEVVPAQKPLPVALPALIRGKIQARTQQQSRLPRLVAAMPDPPRLKFFKIQSLRDLCPLRVCTPVVQTWSEITDSFKAQFFQLNPN
jgi:hypothetical protein